MYTILSISRRLGEDSFHLQEANFLKSWAAHVAILLTPQFIVLKVRAKCKEIMHYGTLGRSIRTKNILAYFCYSIERTEPMRSALI